MTRTPAECFGCPIPVAPVADGMDPGEVWVRLLMAAELARILVDVGCESSWHDAEERGWRWSASYGLDGRSREAAMP